MSEIDDRIKELYDEMLDECCDEVSIGYLSWQPSRVMRIMDEIAYLCGMNDYESMLREEWENDVTGETLQEVFEGELHITIRNDGLKIDTKHSEYRDGEIDCTKEMCDDCLIMNGFSIARREDEKDE